MEKPSNQQCTNPSRYFELIVVIVGRTGHTKEYLEKNQTIIPRHTPNNERGKERNTSAIIATRRYVYLLDSDDTLYPNHLALANQFIEPEANALVVPHEGIGPTVAILTRSNADKRLFISMIEKRKTLVKKFDQSLFAQKTENLYG